jgi:hypothetical protein
MGAHLVQLLLPLHDQGGDRFPRALHDAVVRELTDRFGGLTAYTRAPAAGLWEEDGGRTVRDDVVVYEVMCETLERPWWGAYRAELERRFMQDEIVVRALGMERL